MTDAERIARLEEIVAHQSEALAEIGADVKSLLASRAFSQGVMKTAVWVSSVVATVVSIAVTWLKAVK